MKVYILVRVWFDHYRFQENVFAHVDYDELMTFKNNNDEISKLEIFRYEQQVIDKNKEPYNDHLWVQEFNNQPVTD